MTRQVQRPRQVFVGDVLYLRHVQTFNKVLGDVEVMDSPVDIPYNNGVIFDMSVTTSYESYEPTSLLAIGNGEVLRHIQVMKSDVDILLGKRVVLRQVVCVHQESLCLVAVEDN